MSDRQPRVTVLMPVYNAQKYLRDAIDSILRQSYRDYEFIIIDDYSTDDSVKIIKSYSDSRIRLIENKVNTGISTVLNQGINLADGEYIVRMDADDISLPTRIEKQVNFMDSFPEVGICGTWIKYIGVPRYPWSNLIYRYPSGHNDIKSRLLFSSMFTHPTVIMRRGLLNKFSLRYDPADLDAEDYVLWQKCSFCFPLANIPEVLFLYRINRTSITSSLKNRGLETVRRVNRLNIQNLGIEFTPEELLICRNCQINFKSDFLVKFHSWLVSLKKANASKRIYPEPEFSHALSEEWFLACYRSTRLGIKVWSLFWKFPLSRISKCDKKNIMKFFLKCLINHNTQKSLKYSNQCSV
jgi:glycosyltransferase involved in cell wall biosynthesis